MSERRPHWDDELFDAVIDGFRITPYDDEVYAVIAAVEDWHRDRWTGVCESPEEVVRELKQAQAAIKRVQGICEVIVENAHQFYEVWDEDPTAAQVPYGQWMVARHILRALDGERDG